jgi:ABC-2 type transport system ATP-binding protein
VELEGVSDALNTTLGPLALEVRSGKGITRVVVEGDANVPEVLRLALAGGAKVLGVTPHRDTLEELFVRKGVKGGD